MNDTLPPSAPSETEHSEVLAELERLQQRKTGWRSTLWVLIGSLALFLALGATAWDWKTTLWILPVLVFHEAGHWVAMRFFRYRNLRVFFIPLFGAAVSGQNWNVPGWKKALVSLAGPLPGIALGTVIGIAALVWQKPWMVSAALMLILLNGFNLLPVMPLDGGHVLQDILFCRKRWLDAAFRVLAVVGMLLLGFFGGAPLLKYLGIAMLFSLPLAFKLGRVTESLQGRLLPTASPDQITIPTAAAQEIIGELKATLASKSMPRPKTLAELTITVFERLNARPPGVVGTLALLFLHGGAFLLALVVGIALIIGQQGGLGFLSAAARQPQFSLDPNRIQSWPLNAEEVHTGKRTFVITTVDSAEAAAAAFNSLTNKVQTPASLLQMGNTLVAALPAGDDASREKWFEALFAYSTNTFVAVSNHPVYFSLTCLGPDAQVVTNVYREANAYLALRELLPPWSPQLRSASASEYQEARRNWSRIEEELQNAWQSAAAVRYRRDIVKANQRGATSEAERLSTELAKLQTERQKEILSQLGSPSSGIASDVLRLHESYLSATNAEQRMAVVRQAAPILGGLEIQSDENPDRLGLSSGILSQHGPLLEFRLWAFHDLTAGFPAMIDWLSELGFREFKYEIGGTWELAF